jgi:hypothetical protein
MIPWQGTLSGLARIRQWKHGFVCFLMSIAYPHVSCTLLPEDFSYTNQQVIKYIASLIHHILLLVTHDVPVAGYL